MTKKNQHPQEWMFTSYIQKVIIHAKVDYLRHQGHICGHEELIDEISESIAGQEDICFENMLSFTAATSDILEQIASDERLHQAICALSPAEKKVIYYICIQELTTKETAQLMEISVRWATKLKRNALDKLRLALLHKENFNG